jgi:phosphoribosylanthranilate isomerase
MLAGGLTPENVAQAMRLTGAKQVDVSSGVETAPGIKDERLIASFCAAAQLTI